MRKITVAFFVLLYVGLIGLSEWQVRFWRESASTWEASARKAMESSRRWEGTANDALAVAKHAEKTAKNCAGVVEDFAARLNRQRAENMRLRVNNDVHVWPAIHAWPAINGGVWAASGGAYCGWGITEQEARKKCVK